MVSNTSSSEDRQMRNSVRSFSPNYFYSPCEFFQPVLTDDLSLESELQVFSGLKGLFSVFWPTSTMIHIPISNSCSSLSKPLWTVPSVTIIIGITVTLSCFIAFLFLWQGVSICLSFRFL